MSKTLTEQILEVDVTDRQAVPREMREWLRTSPARGIAPSQKPVDREAHVIHGASILTKGVIKDERFEVDDVMLDQVVAMGNQARKGIRGRFDHPSASSNSMGWNVSRIKNFHRDNGRVRADLHLSESSATSPHGNLRGYIEDLAEEDPDAFGMSIVFRPAKYVYRIDDKGERKTDANGNPLPPLVRIKKLLAADVVDEPAANDGLFSDHAGTPAAKVAAFLDRYFAMRGVEFSSREERSMDPKKKKAPIDDDEQNVESAAGTPASAADREAPVDAAMVPLKELIEPTKLGVGQETHRVTAAAAEQVEQQHKRDLEVARLERQRVAEIQAIGVKLGLEEAAAELCNTGGLSAAAAGLQLLKKYEATPERQPVGPHLEVLIDGRDKFREAAVDALVLRANLADVKQLGEERVATAGELRGCTLIELARESLGRAGLPVRRMSKQEVVRLALGSATSDFPYLLSNVASKAMLKGYDDAPTTWQQWCARGNVPDFKTFTRLRLSESDDLVEVKEGEEFKDSKLEEAREQGYAVTYGRLFSITRQAIINDDMGELTKQPWRFGGAAARLPDDLVYGDLLQNAMGPTMGDGSRLFIDTVGGTIAGANWFDDGDVSGFTSVLDTTNGEAALNHALMLMGKQKGLKGKKRLNLRPRWLLIPPQLEMSAKMLMGSSATVDDYKNVGVINPWQGLATIIQEGRLSESTYTGYSTTAWYLICGTERIDTYEVFFLDGQSTPYLDEEPGFEIDGRRYKVRLDVGVKALERKGFVKSKGAA